MLIQFVMKCRIVCCVHCEHDRYISAVPHSAYLQSIAAGCCCKSATPITTSVVTSV